MNICNLDTYIFPIFKVTLLNLYKFQKHIFKFYKDSFINYTKELKLYIVKISECKYDLFGKNEIA